MKVIAGTLTDSERAFVFLKLKMEKKGRKEKEILLKMRHCRMARQRAWRAFEKEQQTLTADK